MTECESHGIVGSLMVCEHLRQFVEAAVCEPGFVRVDLRMRMLYCLCVDCVRLGESVVPPDYFGLVEFRPKCVECIRKWMGLCGGPSLDAAIEEQGWSPSDERE